MKEFPGEFLRWEITSECTLQCEHCYLEKNTWSMQNIEKKRIAQILDSLEKYQPLKILFLGGEPFERDDFIEILEMASERGFDVSVDTSGHMLDRDKIDRLADIDAGLNISMYGFEPDINDYFTYEGHFRDVEDILEYCRSVGLSVDIAFLLTRINYSQLYSIDDFVKKYGIEKVHLDVYMNYSRSVDKFELSYPQFIKFWLFQRFYRHYPSAHADSSSLNILKNSTKVSPCERNVAPLIKPNGEVWPCMFYGSSIGSLKEVSMDEIIERFSDFRFQEEKCIDCIKTKIPKSYRLKNGILEKVLYYLHRYYNILVNRML